MYSFQGQKWNEQIAEVTGRPEFQTATVTLTRPEQPPEGGNWDWDNPGPVDGGGWVQNPLGEVVYTGQARVIPVRWGVQYGGEAQANAKTISAIRFQIPKDAAPRVHTGCVISINASPDNPALLGMQFTITSDAQGSTSATRTFEAALDGDGVVV